MPDKNLCDEVAELTEAVRELRDREVAAELRNLRAEVERLRADRPAHHCTGCSCVHIHWYPAYQPYPIPGCAPQPTQVWYGTVTSGGTSDFAVTAADVAPGAAGYNPTVTMAALS